MTELPFLKNKKRQDGGTGMVDVKIEPGPGHILNVVADELMDAFHRKDHRAFMEALRAFINLIQTEDEEQDATDSR